MNTITSGAVGASSAFRSWLDHPASSTLPSTNVVARGWCYHRGGESIARVRARVGGRTFEGRHGDPRPDVFAAVGGEPTSDTSGFEVAVRFPLGTSRCQLEVELADGSRTIFHDFAATATNRGRLSGAVPWFTFWTKGILGRAGVWEELQPADRDFLVAWVRQRQWLNLELRPRYSARTVAPEKYPRIWTGSRPRPRFAIVTPSYQQAAFLESTIRSVTEQRGVDVQYVVQDGGSTDGSVEILERYGSKLAHWESAPDRGQADAIVRGFARTHGGPDDVMMYLNSDDRLMPGALRFVADWFATHPEVDLVYGHRVLIDESDREVGRWYTPRRAWDDLRLHDLVPQETLFWRRRIWDRVGGIDPTFQFALDWDLLLRFAAAGAKFARVPAFLGMFRLHDQQKSQAHLEGTGIPEMDRLRLRTLGRPPTDEEMHCSMRRAQFDSALLCALDRYGLRV